MSASNWIEKLTTKLFGDPEKVLLENRIFTAMTFLTFCAAVLSTVENILANLSLWQDVITVSVSIVAIIIYFLSLRAGLWRRLVFPSWLFYLCLVVITLFAADGLDGGGVYYFFILSVAIPLLFDGFRKVIPMVLIGICILVMFYIELVAPHILIPYTSRLQKYGDQSFALFLCLFINGIFVYAVFREYRRERMAKNRLLDSIMEEKGKVEKAVDSKQRLLSMVCHDIANALFTIQSSCMALRHQGPASDRTSEKRLDRLQFAANNMNEIIQSVRLLRAIEEGKASLNLESVDLGAMLDTARVIFFDRLKEKNLRLNVVMPPNGACFIAAEHKIFGNHILSNIISNAIKFSYPGASILVQVQNLGTEISVAVVDRGMGIPKPLLDNLFQRKTSALQPGTRGESGTGLGLFVVKNFVELFNGRIEITSRSENEFPDDHGTTVTMFLKLAGIDLKQSQRQQSARFERLIEPEEVRIIDDAAERNNALEQKVREQTAELRTKSALIEQADLKIRELNRMKELFAGALVQDLKNYIFSIATNEVTLEKIIINNAQAKKVVSRTQSSCTSAMCLIANLADIAKMEDGELALKKERIDGTRVLSIVEERGKHLFFEEKNITVSIQRPPDDFLLMADVNLFGRVLQNLITNAAMYTPEQGEVRIGFGPGSAVHICNSGDPIPEKFRTMVFEKYSRMTIDSSIYSKGLGLFFCKMVMEAHGGEIRLACTEKGNRFTLQFAEE